MILLSGVDLQRCAKWWVCLWSFGLTSAPFFEDQKIIKKNENTL